MNTAIKYGAVLIGLYLIVYHGSNSGKVIDSGTRGAGVVIKAFQGRS